MQITDVLFPMLLGTFHGKYFMTSHHIVTLYITDICLFELLGLLEMLSLLEVHVLLEMLYLIEVLCLPDVLAYLLLTF